MPAIAAFTINDGATTPVAHTFDPTDIKNGVAVYHDRSGGIAIGFPEASISSKLPAPTKSGQSSNATRMIRQRFAIKFPVLEVTSPSTGSGIQPAPTKSYELQAITEFLTPERATLQNKKDILALHKNFLATSVVTAVVQNSEVVY